MNLNPIKAWKNWKRKKYVKMCREQVHPIDQIAMEVLRYLWIVDNRIDDYEEQDKVIYDGEMDHLIVHAPPMIVLFEWAAGSAECNETILEMLLMQPDQYHELLEQYKEHLIPNANWHSLGSGDQKKDEAIMSYMR